MSLVRHGVSLFANCQFKEKVYTYIKRHYPAAPKRFYKKTGVLYSDGKYEITLDQRKLKTPSGKLFQVESEPLALAVAAEWDAQKEKIQRSSMHLTSLCNTVIDNPNNLTKYDIVSHIVGFLDTDTVLFQSSDDDGLYDLQQLEWKPVIEWFQNRYHVDIKPVRDISGPVITDQVKGVLVKHLCSYNIWAVHGFSFGVDTLKSLILMMCCVDRHINVEKAVLLSRLEEEYQTGHWGRVEWAHDLNQLQSQARLAASVLFVHLNSSSEFVKTKNLVT